MIKLVAAPNVHGKTSLTCTLMFWVEQRMLYIIENKPSCIQKKGPKNAHLRRLTGQNAPGSQRSCQPALTPYQEALS